MMSACHLAVPAQEILSRQQILILPDMPFTGAEESAQP